MRVIHIIIITGPPESTVSSVFSFHHGSTSELNLLTQECSDHGGYGM